MKTCLIATMFAFAPCPLSGQGIGSALHDRDGDLRLGRLEGASGDVFGLIEDVAEGPDKDIYVLDSRLQKLKRFSSAGELLGETGRSGRGPGEFYAPRRLAVTQGGEVLLFDPGNRRINTYDRELRLLEDVPLRWLFEDFCLLGDRWFFQRLMDGFTIHELSREGEVLQSFGRAPEVPRNIPPGSRDRVRRNLAHAQLVCDSEEDLVIAVSQTSPRITVHSSTGRLLWRAEIPEYLQVTLTPTIRGTIAHVPDPETNSQHYLGSTALLPSRGLLIQLSVIGGDNSELDGGQIDSWILDLDSRQFSFRSDSLPRVLDIGIGGTYLVANVPFPVLVRSREDIRHGG